MKQLLTATVAGLTIVAASYAIASIGDQTDAASSTSLATQVPPERLSEIDRLIGVFVKRVSSSDDALNQWTLGRHYLERASITGDAADYEAARSVLEMAFVTNPGNPSVDIPLASARLALHDFDGAIELIEPYVLDPAALAVYGDASLARGDLPEARTAYERLERLNPLDPAVVVRLASIDWQTGFPDGAIASASEGVDLARSAGLGGRALSFYLTYHGQLLFETGRFDEALPILEEAVGLDRSYTSAKIELAHVVAARGDIGKAIQLLEEVLAHGPDADASVVLGDLYTRIGESAAAESFYVSLHEIAATSPDAFRRDLSLFLSNHSRDLRHALELAEADLATRQDSAAFDTLAWALFKNGRFEDARVASDRAISLGTSQASAFFHAGMISKALGDADRGAEEIRRALAMNPFFDALLAVEARQILEGKVG